MKNKTVNIEVSENQHDEYSLLISDGHTGYNLSGGKVGGCDSVCDFDINALELIDKVEIYGKVSPTRAELILSFKNYVDAVEQMNAAMKDGINVQGAMSCLFGAGEMANDLLTKALGK